MNFKEFCKSNANKNIIEEDYIVHSKLNEKQKEEKIDDFNSAYDKYKNLSSEQLNKEFFDSVAKMKQNGTFNKDKISDIFNQLAPFLSDSQKNNFDDLMRKI